MIEILLVDGCGVTRAIELPDDELPTVFHHAHENKNEHRHTPRFAAIPYQVDFAASGEVDPCGRPVYRQVGMGTPPMRFHLVPKKPTLRIEGSPGE